MPCPFYHQNENCRAEQWSEIERQQCHTTVWLEVDELQMAFLQPIPTYIPLLPPIFSKERKFFFGEEIVCARLSIQSPGQTLARIVTFYQYWWSVISLVAAGMYSQKYMMWWCHHCSNIRVCLNLDPVDQFIWRLVAISRHTNMRCVRPLPAEYITPLK